MDWTQIIINAIALLIPTGGLMAIFTIREKKTEMALDNMNKINEQWEKFATKEEDRRKELKEDTVKAIRDFNELYEEKVSEEQEIELVKIDTETFVDAMAAQDFAISMQELETLTSILK